MATMRGLRPARVLAARGVLSGQPPATDLGRVRRLLEVQDEHDVADEAFERRRQVGEPAVEVKPVGAGAHSLPARELVRPRWIAHVIHAEAGREVRRDRALVGGVELMVHEHYAGVHAHLVRMGAGRHAECGNDARALGIAHIDDRGAVWAAHVADVGRPALDHDLASAGASR
jgi:hypothetical protein